MPVGNHPDAPENPWVKIKKKTAQGTYKSDSHRVGQTI